MDRRNFLRSMLGVAAATALPSEVWPFRKIFLPPKRSIVTVLAGELENAMRQFGRELDAHMFAEGEAPGVAAIQAMELEAFAKSIPRLVGSESKLIYGLFKKNAMQNGMMGTVPIELYTPLRVPWRTYKGDVKVTLA